MIAEFNTPTQLAYMSSNSWTLTDLQQHIDSLPAGLHWLYLTGPSAKTITGGICTIWSNVLIFKRNEALINVTIIPSVSQPRCGFRKDNAIWDSEVFSYPN